MSTLSCTYIDRIIVAGGGGGAGTGGEFPAGNGSPGLSHRLDLRLTLRPPTGRFHVCLRQPRQLSSRLPEPRVHPGRDWFFVLDGRVRLTLGDRDITVEAGEAAEFATMTPHAFAAVDGPAELIMIFDRDGQHAHVHREVAPRRPA